MLKTLIKDVQTQLNNISLEVDSFVESTNLRCPTGCGACCYSPEIEAMPVEMLPLAELALTNSHINLETKQCPFFQPNPLNSSKGRCTAYNLRPSLCRIFPYGTSKDKKGGIKWNPCSKMVDKEGIERSRKVIENGKGLTYTIARQKLQDLQPSLAETMPINEALMSAMQYIKAKTCYDQTN